MIKKILLLAVSFGCAMIAVSVVLPLSVDANIFKDSLTRQLEAASGLKINLGKNISIRLLPFARLRAENVSIYSSQPGNPEPFAKLAALDIGVAMVPLLKGRAEITGITLREPVFTLVRDKNTTNWGGALDRYFSDIKRGNMNWGERPDGMTVGNSVLNWIKITDGVLSYKNEEGDINIALSALNMQMAKPSFSSPLEISAKMRWNDKPIALDSRLESAADLKQGDIPPFVFSFHSDGMDVSGNGGMDSQIFIGAAEAKVASLVDTARWLTGRKAVAASPPIPFEIKGNISGMLERSTLKDVVAHFGDNTFTGGLSYDLFPSRPTIAAELNFKKLDITPLLRQIAPVVAAASPAASGHWSDAPFDFSAFKMADSNFAINAEEFIAGGVSGKSVLLHAKTQGGDLFSDIAFADFYRGKGHGILNIKSDGRVDGMAILDGVNAGQLFSALSGNERVSGKLNLRLPFRCNGKSLQEMISTLNGDGQGHILDGSIRGVDMLGMARNVASAFTAGSNSPEKFDFLNISGGYNITNGVIRSDKLSITSPLMQASATGKVDVPAYTLDYRITTELLEAPDGKEAKQKPATEGMGVRASGALDAPVFMPDKAEKSVRPPQKNTNNGAKAQ